MKKFAHTHGSVALIMVDLFSSLFPSFVWLYVFAHACIITYVLMYAVYKPHYVYANIYNMFNEQKSLSIWKDQI